MRKKRNYKAVALSAVMAVSVAAGTFCQPVFAAASKKPYTQKLIIVIDPGHGGSDDGMSIKENGKKVYEKTVNLKIAKAMQKELKTYKNVKVYMTRSTDKTVSLSQRTKYAAKKNADIYFSIHNNAQGSAQEYTDGACAIVSRGTYHKELATASTALAKKVLTELNTTSGVENRGLLKRASSRNYPNGKTADYYAVTRMCTLYGIPSVLVEHSFMDDDEDYSKMDTDEELEAVGKADADATASYYGLTKKDGSVSYKRTGHYVKFTSRYWMKKDGKTYYIKKNEKPATGWKTIGKYRYHFSKKGVLLSKKKVPRK